MKHSVEHESLSLTTVMFCEREKAKVLRIIIQQNDKPTQQLFQYVCVCVSIVPFAFRGILHLFQSKLVT